MLPRQAMAEAKPRWPYGGSPIVLDLSQAIFVRHASQHWGYATGFIGSITADRFTVIVSIGRTHILSSSIALLLDDIK